MFSSLSRNWCSLFASLLVVFMDLMPLSAAGITDKFSVSVKTDCLGCTIADQFPALHQQLQAQVPWIASTQHFGKRRVTGFTAAATANNQAPAGLKPIEQQAWIAMAERGRMQLFLPQNYNRATVVELGTVRVEVKPLGAQLAKAEQQGKTLVYKNAYPNTDSLQVAKAGRSEEFLYLRNKTAPTVFDYQVRVGKGVQVRLEGGSIAFVDSQSQGVRIERPWLVDSNGQRSESAVHWQVLEGGKHLRLVVEPQGLQYPLVVDPSWTTTGSMSTPRSGHTATFLPNGKVLVAGGSNGVSYLNSAEVYNLKTGTWATTRSMSTARIYHTATLLPNGKVLVAGGSNFGANGISYLSSAELYDPTSSTWSTVGFMSTDRIRHTATLLSNGKVLVTGGFNNSTSYLSSTELYNPQTRAWRSTGSMKIARDFHTATLLSNGKVLVAGGSDGSSALSSAELYNPTSGTWNPTGFLNIARYSHTATFLSNGQVLVAGGVAVNGNGLGNALSSTELYNPTSGTWNPTGFLNIARYSHTATFLSNSQVLVAGGSDGSLITSGAELYEISTGTWSITAPMSTERYLHTATLLSNGALLVVGGENGNVLSSAELYSLSTPSITSISPLVVP
jgi:N-acetylneuraminic acid mutarotase